MNRVVPKMPHCLQKPETNSPPDLSVLERLRARLKWQQQQQQQSFLLDSHLNLLPLPTTQPLQNFPFHNSTELSAIQEFAATSSAAAQNSPCLENGWPGFAKYPIPNSQVQFTSTGFAAAGLDCALSRTSSCPPVVVGNVPADVVAADEKPGRSDVSEKLASASGGESFKKRKADKVQNPKANAAEDTREKRIKVDESEVELKAPEQNNITASATSAAAAAAAATMNNNNSNSNKKGETSVETSKENSKASEVQKPDCIHVRARRGQATDSHSLAERMRREKISERMKYLQDLVPGCNKITGKAGMLDEIINYVQSLQRQVEFLSMKLAAVNPRLDFNMDNFFTKEMFSGCNGSFPAVGMSQEMANPALLQFNPMQQAVASCGLDMAINPPDMALHRTASAPVSVPDSFIDSYFNAHGSSSTWDIDLQSLYNGDFHQGRLSTFPSQSFTGNPEANNLKMEM